MVHHSEWLSKMQEEIGHVVGDNRLPTFDNIPNLPTVCAVVKESNHWWPVTAGGIPHQATRGDVYDGYYIPAGANVHAVQWAIHREPSLYPDPETFNAAR
jgi:cytochrome P450